MSFASRSFTSANNNQPFFSFSPLPLALLPRVCLFCLQRMDTSGGEQVVENKTSQQEGEQRRIGKGKKTFLQKEELQEKNAEFLLGDEMKRTSPFDCLAQQRVADRASVVERSVVERNVVEQSVVAARLGVPASVFETVHRFVNEAERRRLSHASIVYDSDVDAIEGDFSGKGIMLGRRHLAFFLPCESGAIYGFYASQMDSPWRSFPDRRESTFFFAFPLPHSPPLRINYQNALVCSTKTLNFYAHQDRHNEFGDHVSVIVDSDRTLFVRLPRLQKRIRDAISVLAPLGEEEQNGRTLVVRDRCVRTIAVQFSV